ncbi:MAG: hypothetical protein ABFD64_11785 [Armatimonadota bacterium]
MGSAVAVALQAAVQLLFAGFPPVLAGRSVGRSRDLSKDPMNEVYNRRCLLVGQVLPVVQTVQAASAESFQDRSGVERLGGQKLR